MQTSTSASILSRGQMYIHVLAQASEYKRMRVEYMLAHKRMLVYSHKKHEKYVLRLPDIHAVHVCHIGDFTRT
jgi:hypothetical protein